MFKELLKAAWKRTYEAAPWDYLGDPPKLKHSFFGFPHIGNSVTHRIDFFIYIFQAPFLISKNIFKLFTELPLAFLHVGVLKFWRFQRASPSRYKPIIDLLLLLPFIFIFSADIVLRLLLTSPMVVIKELSKDESKVSRIMIKTASALYFMVLSLAIFSSLPMLGGVFTALLGISNILPIIGVAFFCLQFTAFHIRKACSKHLKIEEEFFEVMRLEGIPVEQIRERSRNMTDHERRQFLAQRTLHSQRDPVAERFQDFDPNTTKCALTGESLGIKKDEKPKTIIKALHQNEYKYYHLNALLKHCADLKRLNAPISEIPVFDEHDDLVPEFLQGKLEAWQTKCPITWDIYISPHETWFRSEHGHYYSKEGKRSLTLRFERLQPTKRACPISRKPLDKDGFKKVNTETLYSQRNHTVIGKLGLFKRYPSFQNDASLSVPEESLSRKMSFP